MDDEERARRNAIRREKYKTDEKRKAYGRAYKAANKERVRELGREYWKRRTERDPVGVRAIGDKWRSENPDKVKAAYKKWYSKHGKEYEKKWSRKLRENRRELIMMRNCKNRARELNLPYNLDESDFVIPDVCPVLGIPLQLGTRTFQAGSPSIDRLVPAKGYVKGNVRIISWRANTLKRDATADEMRKVLAYMEREIAPS